MRIFTTAAIVTALFGATAAYADTPGRDWISEAKVRQILAAKGLQVVELEADDGHWEGEARKGTAKFDFHVDAHSGQITKMEQDRD